MLQKNVASQKWLVYAWNDTTHAPVTGDAANITAKISQDHGARNASNDVNPTELESGYYLFDLTQGETDGDILTIIAVSGTANVQVRGVPETLQTTIAATAKDNLSLMYDGTGYVDPTAPSSRAQADGIGAGIGGSVNLQATSDNTGGAIIDSVAFVGSVQSGTFASIEAEDGVYHDIDDVGNDIDVVYGFAVGGGRTAAAVTFAGFVQGNNDEIRIKVFDHVGSDWEIIGTIPGSNGTTNVTLDLPLLLKHTGTGAELGNVYIRLETDSTTPSNLSVDKLLVSAVNVGQSVGYANGKVWVNTTAGGVAGTEPYVNGVADQAVDLWPSALTLATSVGLSDFHIINGSAIVLSGNSDNFSLFGDNWTLALNGKSVAGAYFQGAEVSGIGVSSAEVHFEGCDIATVSVQIGHFDSCSFSGTVTMTLAGDYNFHDCHSKVPGAATPFFDKTAGQAITAQWRRWSGGLTLSGIEAGDVFTISGELGTVELNGAEGIVEIRGTYRNIVDNRTGSPTLNIDGAIQGADVADIKAKTDSLTFTVAGEVDSNVQSLNGTTLVGDGSATPWGP